MSRAASSEATACLCEKVRDHGTRPEDRLKREERNPKCSRRAETVIRRVRISGGNQDPPQPSAPVSQCLGSGQTLSSH